MKIYNTTNDENIEKARLIVMMHYKDDEFLNRVIRIIKFNHTHVLGVFVAHDIQSFDGDIYLRHYKPFNPLTKAIAYAEGNKIFFNSRKNMPWIERVETIFHESLHLMGYSHKGNYVNAYNLNTVPYKVAAIFKEYVSEIYKVG